MKNSSNNFYLKIINNKFIKMNLIKYFKNALFVITFVALVDVDLAEDSERSVRTGAGEGVDQVVTHSAVAAGIGETVVDVELAVGAVEPGRTSARVEANQILAGGSVLTGSRIALVDLVLTVASSVT